MKAKLLVVGSEVKATEINLRLPAIVGRGRDATLTLPHPLVSRKHCELFEVNGTLMVRDLGSLNGTYVGSQRVAESPVPPGELLTIGTVNFRAVYPTPDPEDDNELSKMSGNDDSTHGPSQARKTKAEPHDTVDEPATVNRSPIESKMPIDRDTEWQIGNSPPRTKSDEDDDLSSFFDDLQQP